jgi:hypothetical protein
MGELRNVELSELINILLFLNSGNKDFEVIWWTEDNNLILGTKDYQALYIIPNKVLANA